MEEILDHLDQAADILKSRGYKRLAGKVLVLYYEVEDEQKREIEEARDQELRDNYENNLFDKEFDR